jgi:hypothetical protein
MLTARIGPVDAARRAGTIAACLRHIFHACWISAFRYSLTMSRRRTIRSSKARRPVVLKMMPDGIAFVLTSSNERDGVPSAKKRFPMPNRTG